VALRTLVSRDAAHLDDAWAWQRPASRLPHVAPDPTNPLVVAFAATAEDIARDRPEVPPEVIREVMAEAATRLHDGLALDGLDEHDTVAVVDGLCEALSELDPGQALRARAAEPVGAGVALHDPAAVSAAYVAAAGILKV
jgi:hypothetical protein